MKRFAPFAAVIAVSAALLAQQPATPPPQGRGAGRGRGPAPVQVKPEDLARIREKSEQIEAIVKDLRAKKADPALLGDVEIYAKAGRFLIEYPELINTQNALDHSTVVLDQGIERARQLQNGQSPWTAGASQIHAYYSELDGSVQPYHVSLPANYDPAKPVRLYVWLHGRQNNTTESEFIFSFMTPRPPGNAPVADQGQIQLDCFGRINGAGWHWGGESDVFEAIAAVKKRFKIDDKRIMLRGFSQGGEGGWHVAHTMAAASARDLGGHGKVRPEHFQPAAGRARRRYGQSNQRGERAPGGAEPEFARATRKLAPHPRATRKRGLRMQGRARFSALRRYTRNLPDLAEDRARDEPVGAAKARRVSQRVGRPWTSRTRSRPLRNLHHSLQPGLLGFGRRNGPALRARGCGRDPLGRRKELPDRDA
jgi:hypothetical protein